MVPRLVAPPAAVATVRPMRDEKMIENATTRGLELMVGLRKLQEEHSQIGDVRGLGLMIGTEFIDGNGKPNKAAAKSVISMAEKEGLLLLSCGTYDNTIRWIPPLNVTPSQISDGLKIFSKALKDL